jgi:tripartite-type tricarboxylate transporter receptor subunit TctC
MWGDAMLRAQGRWSHTDLEPIGYLNSDPLSWVGPTDGPYKDMTLKQIVQTAKDKPNTVRAATVPGSMWDYILDQVEANTGAKFLRVPFQGAAPASALAGGNVDIAQGFYSNSWPGQEQGQTDRRRGLQRMSFMKDAPTISGRWAGTVSVDHHRFASRAERVRLPIGRPIPGAAVRSREEIRS